MHDEKKIEEILKIWGIPAGIIPIEAFKQYAEHLVQQYKNSLVNKSKKLFKDEHPVDCIDGETPVETYGYEEEFNLGVKSVINLINKEDE